MYNSIGPDKKQEDDSTNIGSTPKKETMSLWDIGKRLDDGLGV